MADKTVIFDVLARSKATGFEQTQKKFHLVAAAAGLLAIKIGKDSVNAASDMNESLSKSGVVFGKLAPQVEKWSEKSATAFGLSKQEAVEAASTFGNFFEAMKIGQPQATKMSENIVQLAGDLASFNNADPSQVLEDLRSGLAGQVEPLRKYGVDLSDVTLKQEAMRLGLVKTTTGTLPVAIKSQAAYSLIMKQTATAQGDFARTSDGAANQQRILAAEFKNAEASLGKVLLPALVKTLHVLTGLASGFERNKAVLVPLVTTVAGLAGGVWAVNKATAVWKATTVATTTVMGLFKIRAVESTVATEGLAAAEVTATEASAGLRTGLGRVLGPLAVIVGTAEALKIASDKFQGKSFMHDVLDPHNADVLKVQGSAIDALRSAYWSATGATEASAQQLLDWGSKAENARIITTRHATSQKDLNKALADLRTQLGGTKTATDNVTGAYAANQAKAASLTTELNKVKTSAAGSTDQINLLGTALDKLSNTAVDAKQQELHLKDSMQGVIDAAKDNGHSLDENTAKGRANKEGLLDLIRGINDHAVSVGKQTGSVKKATEALNTDETALRRSMTQAGYTKKQIDDLIHSYAATPKDVRTKVEAATAAAAAKIRALQAQIDRLKGKLLYVDVYERVHTAKGAPALGGKPAYASGSWNVPNTGLALIHQNEMIIPAAPAERIRRAGGMSTAGGTTYNITIKVLNGDPRATIREIEQWLGRGGKIRGLTS